MNDDEREAIADFVVAIGNAFRAINEAGDHLINVLGKPILEAKTAQSPTLAEIKSLKSETKTSSKGNYQLVTKAENSGNLAFEKLQKYIADHGGFVNLHNMKFWNFSNDPKNKIGYKKQ